MTKTEITVEPGKQEIIITREFDAPPEVVFKAMTDPDLIPRWWGPRMLTTTVEKMDARPGGSWRFVQRDPGGNEYAFHGVYHEVTSPKVIIQTFEFEAVPGHVALDTGTFEDLGGRTRLTSVSVFQTVEDRDGMVQSGMEAGVVDTSERFAEILVEVSSTTAR